MLTQIGVVTLILILISLFVNPKWLLYLTVFFSVFTATAAINIEKVSAGIQPVYVIGSVWLLYVIIKNASLIYKKKITVRELLKGYDKKIIFLIILFGVITLVSIMMPIILKDKIDVVTIDKVVTPLVFSLSNITQYAFLLFMLLLTLSIVIEVKDKKTFDNLIKTLVFATLFIVLLGILQFIFHYIKIPYPHEIFNNNIGYSQQYTQTIRGIKRITSAAVEPSMLSLNLIMVLPIIIVMWVKNFEIFQNTKRNQIFYIVITGLTIVVSVLTFSTSAYIGLVLVVGLILLYSLKLSKSGGELFKYKRNILKVFLYGVVLAIALGVLAVIILGIDFSTIIEAIKSITIDKLNVESGRERSNALVQSLLLFKQSPILGVGWGSTRSYDLFSQLLATTGILGFFTFITIIILSIINSVKSINSNSEWIRVGLIISILSGTILLLLGIPDVTFAYFWIALILNSNKVIK